MKESAKVFNERYREGFIRQIAKLKQSDNIPPDVLKRMIFFGVRYFGQGMNEPDSVETLERRLHAFDSLVRAIGDLTPLELTRVFPVDKSYTGARSGFIDYYYTMTVLRDYGMDRFLGNNAMDILGEYANKDIRRFLASYMRWVSLYRKSTGESGLAEEFAEKTGIRSMTAYENEKGRKYLVDGKTGRTVKLKKTRPMHLRLVK